MQPNVRTLDQLVAESNPVYDAQRANINSQVQTAQNANMAQEQGLAAAQTNAFADITQASARRGALFSGFTPDQQARYTSEKYLPALANLRAASQQTIQGLNNGLLDLNSQQLKDAQATREGDLTKLYNWQAAEADRKFQTEQANIAYQREMEKLRAQQKFEAAQAAASRAASTPATPTFQQAANSALAGAVDPETGKTKRGFAEALILQLQSAYPSVPRQQLVDYVYQTRKTAYGE